MTSFSEPGALSLSDRQKLLNLAAEAAANSYSPYSHFRVGAALLLTDGSIVTGCNVENASYRLTSCAEQAAIARAVSQFGPGIRLRAVAVANLNHAASMPCGACRQTLAEFAPDNALILYPDESGPITTTLGALIPHAFRGEFITPA
ncbi:cytidine deaminase [Granulicella paludicola]|uniref:cytidine deaminase n=1 Tax=Granulicella paludicola TaxID=474951 RepID=UPI0021E02BF2|nr:cytidine deaminase [Granulicella paludicola]